MLRLKLAFKPEAGPRQKKDGFKVSFGPVLQHSRGNIDAMTRGRPGAETPQAATCDAYRNATQVTENGCQESS